MEVSLNIMDSYLNHIISSLTIHDMNTLAVLEKLEATATFKSITKKMLIEETKLSEFKFRKTINRLEAIKFISVIKDGKTHRVCLTEYGELALNKNLRGDV